MSTIKVNVRTLNDWAGSFYDWAEFQHTPEFFRLLTRLHAAVCTAEADFIEKFDYRLKLHWQEPTSTDIERLIVTSDGDFWWEGSYKHRDIHFETDHIAIKDLNLNGDQDLREDIDDEEKE